jgi:5-methylcytosine-specific restriction endonuclease McrA
MFPGSSVGRAGGCITGQKVEMDKRRYKDRREYLIGAVKKRRQKIRIMALEYKGGKCSRCGYSKCLEALEFHHLESSKKDFGISDRGYTRSWEKVSKELDKCDLVCANCHRELHAKMQLSAEKRIEKLGEFREALISK